MKIGLIAAVVFMFGCLGLLSIVMDEGAMPTSYSETMTAMTVVRQVEATDSVWGTALNYVLAPVHWVPSVMKTVTWDYSFLDNPVGGYFKWIIGYPITAAVAAGLFLAFIAILSKVLG